MKFCLIHNSWEPHARRGAEQFILTATAALKAAGHEVSVITTKPWDAPDPSTPEGQSVYYIPSGYSRLGRWPKWLRLVWHFANILNPSSYSRIKRIIDREKPDVVWTHNLIGLGFLPLRLGETFRHIHTIHDIQLLHPSGLLMHGQEGMIRSFAARTYQRILRSLFAPASLIISPSRWLLELHRSNGFFKDNRCEVLPNPLEAKNFPDAASAHPDSSSSSGNGTTAFNFLYVGQIEAHKGVAVLLDAFRVLKNENARLGLIGEGSLLAEMKKENVDPRIEFFGHRTSPEVRAQLEKSAALVVPSLCYENQPTVILEAFATDVPVIGSNFAGIKELLADDRLLFEPVAEALKEKMEWAIACQADALAASRAAYRKLSRSSPAEYMEKLMSFLGHSAD